MITDYASLQLAIADWLNRADLTAVIPTFIQMCDAQLRRRIETKFKNQLSLTIAAANAGVETIPGDRPEKIISLYITSPNEYQGQVNPTSPQELYNNRFAFRNVARRPTVCAIIDQEILFSPLPDQDYDAEMVIEGPLVPLSDSATTNYVMENAPDAYLYGSLAQSAPYLKDDARIQIWTGKFEQVLEELRLEIDRNEWPNTPVAPVPEAYGIPKFQDYP